MANLRAVTPVMVGTTRNKAVATSNAHNQAMVNKVAISNARNKAMVLVLNRALGPREAATVLLVRKAVAMVHLARKAVDMAVLVRKVAVMVLRAVALVAPHGVDVPAAVLVPRVAVVPVDGPAARPERLKNYW